MMVVLYACCNEEPRAASPRLSALVGPSRADTLLTSGRSGCVVTAEVDRHPTVLVVEHGDELEAGAERFEVLPQC